MEPAVGGDQPGLGPGVRQPRSVPRALDPLDAVVRVQELDERVDAVGDDGHLEGVHLVRAVGVVPHALPRRHEDAGRLEVERRRERVADVVAGPRQQVRVVGLEVGDRAGAGGVDVGVEGRYRRVVEREFEVEEVGYLGLERQQAVGVDLEVGSTGKCVD